MSGELWCRYSEGLKLILNGYNHDPLTPDQRKIYLNMLGIQKKDEATEDNVFSRDLPSVRTQIYCQFAIDDEAESEDEAGFQHGYEMLYYLPDLLRYMVSKFDEWGIEYPPINLKYLRSIEHELGEKSQIHIDSSDDLTSIAIDENKEHWQILCRTLEIRQTIAILNRTQHEGDPIKLESQ